MQPVLKVLGGHESYFTGKLEAYLRAKGIPYQNVPFTMERLQILLHFCWKIMRTNGCGGRPCTIAGRSTTAQSC